MTPQEKAVIEAAMALYRGVRAGEDPVALDHDLTQAVECLIYYCEECNAGGHTCPGDGNAIGHTATDCGQHQDDMPGTVVMPLAPELVTPKPLVKHAGADGNCPDYGSTLDSCPDGCASGVCVYGDPSTRFPGGLPAKPIDPVWVETTMTNCLINDRIRIGQEETTVLRSTHGLWHVDTSDYWTPRAWEHVELRMELEAVPGLKQYPPSASIELLCTPERLAVLRIQEGFPGSAVTSSHVD